jgi:hypothetical protein
MTLGSRHGFVVALSSILRLVLKRGGASSFIYGFVNPILN